MNESNDSKQIRILHVIGSMNRGGAETMIMNLYRNIDRESVQFDFVQNEGAPAAFDEEIQTLGGRIYHCPRYRGTNHFCYSKWWKQFFAAHPNEYIIVHGHIGSTAAIYLSIAKQYGAFAIAHSHSAGKGNLLYRMISFPTRYIADYFFACSKDAGVSRYGKVVGTDRNRCQVLNNAIETQKFLYSPVVQKNMRKKLHIPDSAVVVGHVGRFVEAKNHLFLIEVFEQVQKKRKDSVLLLIGDGELREQIETVVAEKQLTESVLMTGVQPNVWDYYQAMDVFVFPSIYEGLPVSMVEAQTAGLPCLVSANVPLDSKMTDVVDFISLEQGAAVWAEHILRRSEEGRYDTLSEVQKAGFDVSFTAQWLEDFYMKVVTSHVR